MNQSLHLPWLPARLMRLMLHGGEREEVMAEVAEEYRERVLRGGRGAATQWLWRQVLGSAPGVVRRNWHSGTTGFESEANRMRPGGQGLESWIMDMRFALRGLRSRPQYVLLAVLTLALGIGGTTAVFAIARAVLLAPLPYAKSDELVLFWNMFDWSEAEMVYLRDDWRGFAGVAAYRSEGVFLKPQDAPAKLVPGVASSAELFDVLGARPALGRGFARGADAVGAEATAVLSHSLWQELGGTRDMVGSTVQLDGEPRRVVGVMPEGFWFPDPSVRVWLSTPMRPDNRSGNYAMVARRAPGRSMEGLAEPLRHITARLSQNFTYSAQWDKTKNAVVTPLRDHVQGPVRPALLATLAGMGVILLMACANVATLMLGQLRGRASEFAVRVALGAGRRRLTQQLVIESLGLALVSGVVGAAVAVAGFRLLLAALPLGELASAVRADWTLFAIAFAVALGAAFLIALAPVFSLWRGDLREALSRARSGGVGAGTGRLEDALVIGEVALAVLLAASAAVLIRSVENLRAVDSGVETRGVGVVDVSAASDVPEEVRQQQVEQMVSALAALPGVRSAAAVQRLPLRDRGDNWGIRIESQPELEANTTAFRMVTRDYFSTMGIPIIAGRAFDASDRMGSEAVIVIDEPLARKYFAGQDPLGQQVSNGTGGFARVIGVVGAVAHTGLTDEAEPGRYVLFEQLQYAPEGVALVLRTERGSAGALLEQAVHTVQQTTGSFAVREATTMESVLAFAMGPTRRIMQLITLLGALALALGGVGVYGVVSQFVHRRRRDWVIRMALGMKPLQALGQVVGRGAILVALGCALGLVAAATLTRLITSLLYQVDPADPIALAAAAATLIATGCIAALVPALRASRANPAQVLRDSA